MIDKAYLNAHSTATIMGPNKRCDRLIGRTEGGMNTKLHAEIATAPALCGSISHP